MQGLGEGLKALHHGAIMAEAWQGEFPRLQAGHPAHSPARVIGEQAAKLRLAAFGLPVPAALMATPDTAAAAAESLGFPVVMKISGAGIAHKSERGGVLLDIGTPAAAERAARQLGVLSRELLVEQMITGGIVEMLVGVVSDPQFGQVLVLGSGGVQAELWIDTVRLLPPWTSTAIEAALRQLTCWPLLTGYRGQPRADTAALIRAVLDIATFAAAHRDTLLELDVNPLIVRREGHGVMAVDALIRELPPGSALCILTMP
jgi:acetyl-CoA synthetase